MLNFALFSLFGLSITYFIASLIGYDLPKWLDVISIVIWAVVLVDFFFGDWDDLDRLGF